MLGPGNNQNQGTCAELQALSQKASALAAVPVLAPPGAEDLALRTLAALLSPMRALRMLRQVAASAVSVRAPAAPLPETYFSPTTLLWSFQQVHARQAQQGCKTSLQ